MCAKDFASRGQHASGKSRSLSSHVDFHWHLAVRARTTAMRSPDCNHKSYVDGNWTARSVYVSSWVIFGCKMGTGGIWCFLIPSHISARAITTKDENGRKTKCPLRLGGVEALCSKKIRVWPGFFPYQGKKIPLAGFYEGGEADRSRDPPLNASMHGRDSTKMGDDPNDKYARCC
jgi:hypothetical protein